MVEKDRLPLALEVEMVEDGLVMVAAEIMLVKAIQDQIALQMVQMVQMEMLLPQFFQMDILFQVMEPMVVVELAAAAAAAAAVAVEMMFGLM